MSKSDVVLYEILESRVALVTINRPEAGNSINGDVTKALYEVVSKADEDEHIRVVVLTGAGTKTFCAGADLSEVAAGKGADLVHPVGGFAGLVHAKPRKPWITAVKGAAMGGGLELALSTDMIVASEEAVFGLPEVKVGVAALAGGIYRLPQAIPRAVALEMIATGEPIGADRAYELGLVNRVAAADQVLEAALQIANVIASNAPLSVCESLVLARQAHEATEEQLRTLNDQLVGTIMSSEDSREGPRAFLEKRKPHWKGR